MSLPDIAKKYGLSPEAPSGQYTGSIDGEEIYSQFLEDLKAIGVTFSTYSARSGRGGNFIFNLERSVKSAPSSIAYFGMPFQVVKTTYKLCSLGGPYRQNPRRSIGEDRPIKRRFSAKPTKKINCPAKMTVRCLRVFDEDCYRAKALIYKAGAREFRRITQKLREDLQSPSPPTGVLRFNIIMSSAEEHSHTTVTSKLCSIIHPRLREEIHNYVVNNMCSTKMMKAHLEEVVREMFEDGDMPKPDRQNRCYYPSSQSIRTQMHKALYQVKQGKYDQDALGVCIDSWQLEFPGDNFSFRPYEVLDVNEADEESTCSSLLFCHQTKWQQDLMARYGDHISLLDAAYKTTKFDVPLYFIVVKTNSCYCVVGTFVVQSESNVLIAEALSQFREWNPDWEPKYFMADNSEAGVTALEETFPDSTVYLCAFHREQTWHAWLMKTANVPRRAITPLRKLWQNIAASCTEEEYVQSVNAMHGSKVYEESPNVQRYFSNEWLPVINRWVPAFLAKDFLSKVNTNNGVESQNKILYHTYLKNSKYSTLSGLIKTIVNSFLPDILNDYCIYNAKVDYEYYETLPKFLLNRPMAFIDHVMERLERGKEYDPTHITDMGEGLFFVRNESKSNEWFKVDFQEATCKCFDFAKWRYPCEHMCAVFLYTEWGFDKLPPSYRDDPYVTVDTNYTAIIGVATNNVVQDSTCVSDSSEEVYLTSTIDYEEYYTPHNVDPTHAALSPLPTNYTPIDEKKGRLELQRNLTTMMGYATLQFTPENLKKVIELSEQWTETIRSLVTKSKEGLLLSQTEENASVDTTHVQKVKDVKKTYVNLPKRIKARSILKTSIR